MLRAVAVDIALRSHAMWAKLCLSMSPKNDLPTFKPAGNKDRKRLLFRLAGVHGWRCWYCGRPLSPGCAPHVDHIEPKSRGGDDGFFNLALACRCCNMAKCVMSLDEFVEWISFVKSDESCLAPTIRKRCKP